jgi:hypothetical protein
LLGEIQRPLPPASEREARMDDPRASGVKTTPEMKRAFGAPGTRLTIGHRTTVILQDCHPERLSFRAEPSVVEESASRSIR